VTVNQRVHWKWQQEIAVKVAGHWSAPSALMLGQAALAADAPASRRAGWHRALEQAWRLHPQAAALDARDAEAQAARDIAGGMTPEPGAVSHRQPQRPLQS
jgi:hypothetical protein